MTKTASIDRRYDHTERYDQAKVDRLKYIDEIYANTTGWTVQLFNLYEERKRLRLSVSRMRKPHAK